MTVDVLDHNDGVVDQDPDREDQREQTDAVEGVTEEVGSRQRQGEGDGDDDRDHGRFAPRQRDPHQENDGEGGGPQMFEKLICLFVGGRAIVPGLEDFDVRGQDGAAQAFDHLIEVGHHVDRVGARFLGDGHRHRRHVHSGGGEVPFGRRRARSKPHVGRWILRALPDLSDIRQVDRAAAGARDHEAGHIVAAGQKLADVDHDLVVGDGSRSCRQPPVDGLDCGKGLQNGDVVRGQPLAIEIHPDHATLTADDRNLSDPWVLRELGLEFVGDRSQLDARRPFGPQGVGDDRYIVDGSWFDNRGHDADRQFVEYRLELGVDPDRRLVGVGTDQESHHDEPTRRIRDRVDVLHVLDFVEQLFERRDDPDFDFLRGGAGKTDHDVDHGDLDLGLLLRRRHDHREDTEEEGCDDDQRRQLGVEKCPPDAAGDTELAAGHLEAESLAMGVFDLPGREFGGCGFAGRGT